jgi:superfamily II DNA or RNA helicase
MSKTTKKYSDEIKETFSYGVIYVYSIPLPYWKGRLKIGSTRINIPNPTQQDIETAARGIRIKNQTQTADVPFILEHAELSITKNNDYFSDQDVHNVLIRSGYPRKAKSTDNSKSEWFEIDLETAKNAIKATREGRRALTNEEKSISKISPFQFRPNQLDAIDKTTKAIKKNRKHFLWNAKMRFGKTSAAMQVAKDNEMKKVLIVTHRPSVSTDWYNDFNLVLASVGYEFSSKDKGEDIKVLVKNKKPFVYFASLQDLRLSKQVVEDGSSGSKAKGFEKNDEIFDTTWDMLIIDEAHEGTQSNLGDTTFTKIPTNFTLQLSGTPFNILHKHEEEDIYTWDYVMEQEEKNNWDENYPGVPNPYAELPSLSIFTYNVDTFASHIGSLGENFHDSLDGAFKFHEFFRVHKDEEGNDTSKFIHESMVKKFLDLLVNDKLVTKFPYATQEYRNYNKHSLWLLPNRTEVILAMQKLLKDHPVFGSFGIVNISGDNYSDDEETNAKERVTKAIKDNEYTITLTGQRLTTGASVPDWTAVFMMSDTNSATTYLQTAFRCQTPAKIDGKIKTQGYVFDFAPDRTLKLIAEAIELNHKSGKTNSQEQKDAMSNFLNFCPILAAEGGNMIPYDVGKMLTQLKKAIIERVSRNGFDDPKLYNDELLKLDQLDIEKFNQLKKIVGNSTSEKINEIKISELGMDDLKTKQAEELERKQKKELSEEDKEKLKKLKEARDQKKNAISILRAVSIRMPMLVYGAHVSIREDINLKKFIELVDEESWKEFMPEGLTKEGFSEFTKYYDEEVFRGVTKSIRAKVFDCDNLLPTDRIRAIAEIFGTFKNPDKETVLTPWSVVNKHLTLAFGGHNFSSGVLDKKTDKPEWVSKGVDTTVWEKDDTKILEINSKSGLYPLLAAYNVYSRKIKNIKKPEEKIAKEVWNKVLKENIYVLCKSPMAQSITFRTLVGYNEGVETSIVYIHDLIKKIQQKDEYKDYDLKVELLEKFNLDKKMKFTAVVGNPPYQGENHSQIYPYFYLSARELGDSVSLIFPVGWQDPKNGNNLRLLNNKDIKQDPQIIFIDNRQNVFPGISGAEWTNIILWKKGYNNGLDGKQKLLINGKDERSTFFETEKNTEKKPNEIKEMVNLVIRFKSFNPMQEITSVLKPYGLRTDVIKDPKKYKLPSIQNTRLNKNDLKLYAISGKIYYLKFDYPLPRKTKSFSKYKIFVPYAWGNMAEKTGLGGAYSDIIIAKPFDVVTETYQEQGPFETEKLANYHAKFLMTKFVRALLYFNKHSQHSTTSWGSVPIQDYSEKWWNKTIDEIDKELMEKYDIPKNIQEFVFKNIQTKTEKNIINFSE